MTTWNTKLIKNLTITVTVLQCSETPPSFQWCCVAMEFSSQHHTIYHPSSFCVNVIFLHLLGCFILFLSVFILPLLSLCISDSSFLHALCFLQSFNVFVHLSLPLFLTLLFLPGYIVLLHAFSICFLTPFFQPLLS